MLQVGKDNRLYNEAGPIKIQGIHILQSTFGLFNDGYRNTWEHRLSQPGNAVLGYSPPIPQGGGLGPWLNATYKTAQDFYNALVGWKDQNFNCIRFYVDCGFYQTASFTDSVSGNFYPAEPDIVDTIIEYAKALGMYVWIAYAHASPPLTNMLAFWNWMGDRYKDTDNVIFELQSEPGGTTQLVYNDSTHPTTGASFADTCFDGANWVNAMPSTNVPTATAKTNYNNWLGAALTAVRGAGFRGPVAVSPMCNLWNVNTIIDCLEDAGQPYKTDPNLLITVHPYYFYGSATAFDVTLPSLEAQVDSFSKYWAIINGEVGYTNANGATGNADALAWDQKMCNWSMKENINGTVFFCDAPGQADSKNDIYDPTTGYLTDWGQRITQYYTYNADVLASYEPKVWTTGGAPTDYSGSIIKWRIRGKDTYMRGVIKTPTNGGSVTGPMLVELPTMAPSNGYQTLGGCTRSDGTVLKAQIIGRYLQISTFADAYPATDGGSIFFNFWYTAESSGFDYDRIVFDGTYRLLRGANLTGIADGKNGTAVVDIEFTGGDGAQQRIFSTNNSRWSLFRRTDNKLQVQLRNTANTIIGACTSTSTHSSSTGRHIVHVDWALGGTALHMYVDGVDVSSSVTATNDTVDYTDTNWCFGGRIGDGVENLQAKVSFGFVATSQIAANNIGNRALFADYKNKPIELGKYAERPFGLASFTQPIVFIRQLDTVASGWVNYGTGGTLTKT